MSSKRLTINARDLMPGDVVRLVYEIKIDSVDDLDTVIPTQTNDILFIKGTVKKGPLRGKTGEFAVNGNDRLEVKLRPSALRNLVSRLQPGGIVGSAWQSAKDFVSSKTA
jgi:hypothetical protein